MVDVALRTAIMLANSNPQDQDSRSLVQTSGGNWYWFVTDIQADLFVFKSTDGRKTWQPTNSGTAIHLQVNSFTVYADWWTPGISGTLIHIAIIDAGIDDVVYYNFNTSDDSLSSMITIFAGATASPGSVNNLAMAKMRGGKIHCAYNIDGGTEKGIATSSDDGANWTTRTAQVYENANDHAMCFPGNEADNNDAWFIFGDLSAGEWSLKVFDDDADSIAETSISSGISLQVTSNYNNPFAGLINPADNHLYFATWVNVHSVTAEMLCWDINGAASITPRTDILTDTAGNLLGLIYDDGNVIAVYCKSADSTDLTFHYKVSTDGMQTWGAEQDIFTAHGANIDVLSAPQIQYDGEDFPGIMAMMQNTDPFIEGTSLPQTSGTDIYLTFIKLASGSEGGGGAVPGTVFSQGVQRL